mgnify:FL=1|jgi:hypothetical protein|tara:strand:- start:60 stop:278 length:219 start_codon:yes stop_codon:yes gene_type:complete
MTTYSYKIVLNDSEAIMLKAALELMMTHCQEKLDSDAGAPYWAHKRSAQSVLNKLYANTIQTSGNNFFNDKK